MASGGRRMHTLGRLQRCMHAASSAVVQQRGMAGRFPATRTCCGARAGFFLPPGPFFFGAPMIAGEAQGRGHVRDRSEEKGNARCGSARGNLRAVLSLLRFAGREENTAVSPASIAVRASDRHSDGFVASTQTWACASRSELSGR